MPAKIHACRLPSVIHRLEGQGAPRTRRHVAEVRPILRGGLAKLTCLATSGSQKKAHPTGTSDESGLRDRFAQGGRSVPMALRAAFCDVSRQVPKESDNAILLDMIEVSRAGRFQRALVPLSAATK